MTRRVFTILTLGKVKEKSQVKTSETSSGLSEARAQPDTSEEAAQTLHSPPPNVWFQSGLVSLGRKQMMSYLFLILETLLTPNISFSWSVLSSLICMFAYINMLHRLCRIVEFYLNRPRCRILDSLVQNGTFKNDRKQMKTGKTNKQGHWSSSMQLCWWCAANTKRFVWELAPSDGRKLHCVWICANLVHNEHQHALHQLICIITAQSGLFSHSGVIRFTQWQQNTEADAA